MVVALWSDLAAAVAALPFPPLLDLPPAHTETERECTWPRLELRMAAGARRALAVEEDAERRTAAAPAKVEVMAAILCVGGRDGGGGVRRGCAGVVLGKAHHTPLT
jgi:hypothetical protein